jgi:hypothetical protein
MFFSIYIDKIFKCIYNLDSENIFRVARNSFSHLTRMEWDCLIVKYNVLLEFDKEKSFEESSQLGRISICSRYLVFK